MGILVFELSHLLLDPCRHFGKKETMNMELLVQLG
jgi:hypothetical protein